MDVTNRPTNTQSTAIITAVGHIYIFFDVRWWLSVFVVVSTLLFAVCALLLLLLLPSLLSSIVCGKSRILPYYWISKIFVTISCNTCIAWYTVAYCWLGTRDSSRSIIDHILPSKWIRFDTSVVVVVVWGRLYCVFRMINILNSIGILFNAREVNHADNKACALCWWGELNKICYDEYDERTKTNEKQKEGREFYFLEKW